ncbi:hypothetical protein [Bosea thiooxidans]
MRVTHIPTNTTATVECAGTQLRNKEIALEMILAAVHAPEVPPMTSPNPARDGWKLVPVETTLDKQHAYFDEIDRNMKRVETDATFGRYKQPPSGLCKNARRCSRRQAPCERGGCGGGEGHRLAPRPK